MDALTNLYLIDMSHANTTSGVDRYIGTLIHGLQDYPHIRIYWIHLVYDTQQLFLKEEQEGTCLKYTIPLPQQYNSIIAQRFWIRRYNEQVYRLISHLFQHKQPSIVHIHTLNLIDLAILLREKTECRIITHLHCIPWKGLYNRDKKRFNQLYQQTYITTQRQNIPPEAYLTNNCELDAYQTPDALICVTQCAVSFLQQCIRTFTHRTIVISNGIDDAYSYQILRSHKSCSDIFHCIFVGVANESKGISYILEAINKVQLQGYRLTLTMAGSCSETLRKRIKHDYPNLEVNIMGCISFEQLKTQYQNSDIGLIGSLQEQASYAAIEMAMFGLPIVTTAVDGLDEIFTDEVNALKVNTKFSFAEGLSVDIDMMSRQIIRLIEEPHLRSRLSQNVRQLYQKELRSEIMIKKTVEFYGMIISNDI